MNKTLLTCLAAGTLALGTASASASSIGVVCPNGEATEISCVLNALSAIPVDTTGVVALGKLGTSQIPSGTETENYGLGLDATTSDVTYSGSDLVSFDMALNSVSGYSLFAVYIKAGNENSNDPAISGIIYYNNMFDDMVGPNDRNISHASYFGKLDTPVVPLPAAGWMLLAGVGGLAAMRRRKKKS